MLLLGQEIGTTTSLLLCQLPLLLNHLLLEICGTSSLLHLLLESRASCTPPMLLQLLKTSSTSSLSHLLQQLLLALQKTIGCFGTTMRCWVHTSNALLLRTILLALELSLQLG